MSREEPAAASTSSRNGDGECRADDRAWGRGGVPSDHAGLPSGDGVTACTIALPAAWPSVRFVLPGTLRDRVEGRIPSGSNKRQVCTGMADPVVPVGVLCRTETLNVMLLSVILATMATNMYISVIIKIIQELNRSEAEPIARARIGETAEEGGRNSTTQGLYRQFIPRQPRSKIRASTLVHTYMVHPCHYPNPPSPSVTLRSSHTCLSKASMVESRDHCEAEHDASMRSRIYASC